MSLRYLASTNQTHVGDSMTTSISETPSSPSTNRLGGGGALTHTETVAGGAGRSGWSGNDAAASTGSQAAGSICRRERKTFQVTASSLFWLRRCLSLLARMLTKTGS